jgi:hypothetical protein
MFVKSNQFKDYLRFDLTVQKMNENYRSMNEFKISLFFMV